VGEYYVSCVGACDDSKLSASAASWACRGRELTVGRSVSDDSPVAALTVETLRLPV